MNVFLPKIISTYTKFSSTYTKFSPPKAVKIFQKLSPCLSAVVEGEIERGDNL